MTEVSINDAPEPQDNEPTVEERATQLGWKPQDQFTDPKKWVDAETFLRRGEEVLPIVRAEKRKLEDLVAKQRAEIDDMRKDFKEFKSYHSKTEARAYEAALRDLEDRQADAVANNDLKAVREITKEIAGLDKPSAPADPYSSPDHAKAVAAWKAENDWFETDRAMTGAANAIASELEAKGVTGQAQLDAVAKRIREEFPHKFPAQENPRRQAPAAVEGATPARKAGKTRSDLPAEARSTMDRWVKQGLITEAQYLKEYQW